MKTLNILIAAMLLASQANAQRDKFLGVAVHVTLGVKQVNAGREFVTGAAAPATAFSLGGGSSWNINRTVLGGEFYFSSASSTANQIFSRYSGFNSNLYAGYQVIKSRGWQIAPLVGFGKSKNQLLMARTESTNSPKAVQNAGYIVHTALRLEKVNAKGNYLGLKVGYNISTAGNRQWLQTGSNERTGLADDPGGFFVQLNVGGLVKIRKY